MEKTDVSWSGLSIDEVLALREHRQVQQQQMKQSDNYHNHRSHPEQTPGGRVHVSSVAISPNGALVVATFFAASNVRVWDALSGRLVLAGRLASNQAVFSPDGSQLAVSHWGNLHILQLEELFPWPSQRRFFAGGSKDTAAGDGEEPLQQFATAFLSGPNISGDSPPPPPPPPPPSLQPAPAAAAGVRLLTSHDREATTVFEGHRTTIFDVAWSHGRLAFNVDGVANAGEKESGTEASSGDGQMKRMLLLLLVATCSGDETVRIWDIDGRRCMHTLSGHTNNVFAVAFAPDDTVLASGGYDRSIRLWSVRTGECLQVVDEAHTDGPVRQLAFSPNDDEENNRYLASRSTVGSLGGYDGIVDGSTRLWRMNVGSSPCSAGSSGGGSSTSTDEAHCITAGHISNGDPQPAMIKWQIRLAACIQLIDSTRSHDDKSAEKQKELSSIKANSTVVSFAWSSGSCSPLALGTVDNVYLLKQEAIDNVVADHWIRNENHCYCSNQAEFSSSSSSSSSSSCACPAATIKIHDLVEIPHCGISNLCFFPDGFHLLGVDFDDCRFTKYRLLSRALLPSSAKSRERRQIDTSDTRLAGHADCERPVASLDPSLGRCCDHSQSIRTFPVGTLSENDGCCECKFVHASMSLRGAERACDAVGTLIGRMDAGLPDSFQQQMDLFQDMYKRNWGGFTAWHGGIDSRTPQGEKSTSPASSSSSSSLSDHAPSCMAPPSTGVSVASSPLAGASASSHSSGASSRSSRLGPKSSLSPQLDHQTATLRKQQDHWVDLERLYDSINGQRERIHSSQFAVQESGENFARSLVEFMTMMDEVTSESVTNISVLNNLNTKITDGSKE